MRLCVAVLLLVMTSLQRDCLLCGHSHKLAVNKWYKLYCVAAGSAALVSERDGCGYVFRASPSDGEPWLLAGALLTFKDQQPAPTSDTRTQVGWVCSRQYQVRLACLLY
jgi:hypothetical protein